MSTKETIDHDFAQMLLTLGHSAAVRAGMVQEEAQDCALAFVTAYWPHHQVRLVEETKIETTQWLRCFAPVRGGTTQDGYRLR